MHVNMEFVLRWKSNSFLKTQELASLHIMIAYDNDLIFRIHVEFFGACIRSHIRYLHITQNLIHNVLERACVFLTSVWEWRDIKPQHLSLSIGQSISPFRGVI